MGGVADDPRRRRLFATTPSEALKPTVGDDQSQFVDDVLKVLTNEGDFETLKPHAAAIVAAHDALKAKVAERWMALANGLVAGRDFRRLAW